MKKILLIFFVLFGLLYFGSLTYSSFSNLKPLGIGCEKEGYIYYKNDYFYNTTYIGPNKLDYGYPEVIECIKGNKLGNK